MTNPLAAKLRHFAPLSDADVAALDALCAHARRHPAKKDLVKEGERHDVVYLLLEGWACRYKLLPDGSRQIVALLLPGDLCDVQVFLLKAADHSIAAISDARVAEIPPATINAIFDERPNLARALWWSTLTDEATLREWVVNIGRRDSYQRVAHLFAELWLRMEMVGLTLGNAFELPLTQVDISDAVGLTPVHVNRVVQRLRKDGLIEATRGRLRVPNVIALMEASDFNADYLHLDAGLLSVE